MNGRLCLPECLQAPTLPLSHLKTLRWGQLLPTLLSPTEPRPQSYNSIIKPNKRNIFIYANGREPKKQCDQPCWHGSVCRCPSAVGCGTPGPKCGPGASSSGWWLQLSPPCNGSLPASIWRTEKGIRAHFKVNWWDSGWKKTKKKLSTIKIHSNVET